MSQKTRVRARVLRVVLILVGCAPFLPALAHDLPALRPISGALEAWFQFQCHREPLRSFAFFEDRLPVCSRCLGIYLGLALGALVLKPRLSLIAARIWVGTAAVIMVLDVLTEVLGMRPEWGAFRLVTGLLLAYPVSVALVQAARA